MVEFQPSPYWAWLHTFQFLTKTTKREGGIVNTEYDILIVSPVENIIDSKGQRKQHTRHVINHISSLVNVLDAGFAAFVNFACRISHFEGVVGFHSCTALFVIVRCESTAVTF